MIIVRVHRISLQKIDPHFCALTTQANRHAMVGKALFFTHRLMTTSSLRKALGIATLSALFLGVLPQSLFAATLATPTNLSLVGGIYTNDTTPTATWTRPANATWYQVLLDDGDWLNLGNVSSYTLWPLADGWHTLFVRAQGTNATSTSTSITFEIDTVGPTVPAVSPSSATEDQSTTFSVTPSGEAAPTSCDLYVSGSSVGTMTKNGSTFSKAYTFANDGSYTVYARCADGDGNDTTGTSRTVSVVNTEDPDTSGTFTVPSVTPSTAIEDERTAFTVRPTSDYNVTNCWLYVDGDRVATMNEASTNRFTANYTFTNDGNYSVYAYCKDSHGNAVSGTRRTVTVSNQSTTSTNATRGSLIKIPCGVYANTSQTCKAVYYYGHDGKRHVFPNESVFYTWYSNFNDVVSVSQDFMSSLVIGKNVTYRPGSVVVKFDSSPEVYAISADHTLHHYTTLSLLKSDYGSNWTNVLAKVPDALYSNYTIGSEIDNVRDYDRDDAYYSVNDIDDVL